MPHFNQLIIYVMQNLVYAELTHSLTFEMMEDKELLIINDNGIFIITRESHADTYPELEFEEVCQEAIRDYGISEINGRLVSDYSSF